MLESEGAEVKAKRIRKENFTQYDKVLLLSLVDNHQSVIESKKNDTKTLQTKAKVWESIAEYFNSDTSVNVHRSPAELKDLYKRLKIEARKQLSDVKNISQVTCGIDKLHSLDRLAKQLYQMNPQDFDTSTENSYMEDDGYSKMEAEDSIPIKVEVVDPEYQDSSTVANEIPTQAPSTSTKSTSDRKSPLPADQPASKSTSENNSLVPAPSTSSNSTSDSNQLESSIPTIIKSFNESDSKSFSEIHSKSKSEIHSKSISEIYSKSKSEIHSKSISEIYSKSKSEIHSKSTGELYSKSSSESQSLLSPATQTSSKFTNDSHSRKKKRPADSSLEETMKIYAKEEHELRMNYLAEKRKAKLELLELKKQNEIAKAELLAKKLKALQ